MASSLFTDNQKIVKVHGHCHQKALGAISDTILALSLPINYHVELIPSGCCGMAGSFGYEKEHYEVSEQIANITLIPAITEKNINNAIICASGTSCRHQIKDLSHIKALHPIEILFGALNN